MVNKKHGSNKLPNNSRATAFNANANKRSEKSQNAVKVIRYSFISLIAGTRSHYVFNNNNNKISFGKQNKNKKSTKFAWLYTPCAARHAGWLITKRVSMN